MKLKTSKCCEDILVFCYYDYNNFQVFLLELVMSLLDRIQNFAEVETETDNTNLQNYEICVSGRANKLDLV